jgi:hypothetical protein
MDRATMTKIPIKYWRARAEEARAVAEQMNDADSKRKMLRIAQDYKELARRGELRLKQQQQQQQEQQPKIPTGTPKDIRRALGAPMRSRANGSGRQPR